MANGRWQLAAQMNVPLKQFFFVTGLPRSRTAWLANFFTWRESFCLHDAMAKGLNCRAVIDQLLALNYHHAGDSDPALVFIAKELQRLLPEARWLIVTRPKDEAMDSFARHFGARPYPGAPTGKRLRDVYDAWDAKLGETRALLRGGSYLEVPFEDLESKLVLEECWRFLVPGVRWDAARCDLLQRLQVNVHPEKVPKVLEETWAQP